ncbi:hypothetical protein, partial [uncultured Xanthomarina sp.]|uniref:hypothetical protein n=1 Tax=uncultured Xanthomarina sp. TaxID=1868331 RepID=UPI0030D7F0C5
MTVNQSPESFRDWFEPIACPDSYREGELNKRKPLQRCRGFFGFMVMIPCVYILQSKQLNRFY